MAEEFYCFSCNRHKPIDQLAMVKKHTNRKHCKSCVDKITKMKQAQTKEAQQNG